MGSASNPLFSIVIPVYNNSSLIVNAVDSVISQGFDDCEVIIIDDGSTDDTSSVVDCLAKKYPNVKAYHQDNQWIYASMNNGVARATGEYVYILNSDDRLAENSLRILANAVEEYHHPDVIWTRVLICYSDSRQNVVSTKDNNPKVKCTEFFSKKQDAFEDIMVAYSCGLLGNQANLYKTSIAKKVKFRNDVYGADRLYNYSIMEYVTNFVILDADIYHFYVYNEGRANTSIGKYYGYEQYMFNEFYNCLIKMLQKLNICDEENTKIARRERCAFFTIQLNLLLNNCRDVRLIDKVKVILNDFIDDTILECLLPNDKEELDARIFSSLEKYSLLHMDEIDSDAMPVYEFLEALLRYEHDENDFEIMRNFVYSEMNPHHIGECFLNRLKVDV